MAKINCKVIRDLINSSVDERSKRLSIFKLSKIIGVDKRMLTRMGYDIDYNPGVLTMLKLSEYFNMRIDDLLIKD